MSDQTKVPLNSYDASGAYTAKRIGGKFSSELFANSAVNFLESYQGSDPFLLYVAFTSPHDPRMAPKQFAAMYSAPKLKVPVNYLPQHPFDNGELKVRDEMLEQFPRSQEAIQAHLAGYYAMVSEVDAQIGRILNALDRSGKAEDTIVVFAADNGLAVGRHGLLGKQNLYDHSVRVPLVIAGPDLPKNKKVDSLVYLLDLFPTLTELAGVKTPSTVEGKSLVPLIRGGRKSVRDSVYLAYRGVQRSVRTERWKLIEYTVAGKRTVQLFDLKTDPEEFNNLALQKPRQAEELRRLLKQWMKDTDDPSEWAA
ncbi:MAG: sulfatase-like hydrolase/transferase [Bryobacteraceae bacterium]